MDSKFPPDQNSAKDDFIVPESGPGEEAANFSAKAQQDKFLGGGGSSEVKPQPQTVERKTYRPDQELNEMEKRTEGNDLIRNFVGILKPDPEVRNAILEAYFRYDKQGGPSSEISFKRGTGEYSLDTTSGNFTHGDKFRIQRTEGKLREILDINIGRLTIDRGSINYNATEDKPYRLAGFSSRQVGEINEKNNGSSVNKGRELLAKTQKDFGNELSQNNPPAQAIP